MIKPPKDWSRTSEEVAFIEKIKRRYIGPKALGASCLSEWHYHKVEEQGSALAGVITVVAITAVLIWVFQ